MKMQCIGIIGLVFLSSVYSLPTNKKYFLMPLAGVLFTTEKKKIKETIQSEFTNSDLWKNLGWWETCTALPGLVKKILNESEAEGDLLQALDALKKSSKATPYRPFGSHKTIPLPQIFCDFFLAKKRSKEVQIYQATREKLKTLRNVGERAIDKFDRFIYKETLKFLFETKNMNNVLKLNCNVKKIFNTLKKNKNYQFILMANYPKYSFDCFCKNNEWLSNFFDYLFVSGKENILFPSPESFDSVIKKFNIKDHSDCILIDRHKKHFTYPRKKNMHCINFDAETMEPEKLTESLKNIGITLP